MSEVKHNQLISLACNFNSEFKHFLAAHDSRALLELKSDITQEEQDNLASWYQKSITRLVDHQFESMLEKFPAYRLFKDMVQRVSLHDSFKGSHNDDSLLKIFTLRIIAGALEMHSDPLREDALPHLEKKRQALKANLGTLIIPNEQTANAAQRLIKYIKKSGAAIDWMQKLEAVAAREPYPTINKTVRKKALIREVSLLSKMLLNTSNEHANRFPYSAIQQIFGFIDEEITDEGIRLYQKQFDNSDEKYLSTGRADHLAH